MSEVKPISPDDIDDAKYTAIPSELIQIVNNLIVKNYSSGYSVVYSNVIRSQVREKLGQFHDKWLSIEDKYQQTGWKVQFLKPPGGFDSFFVFTKIK